MKSYVIDKSLKSFARKRGPRGDLAVRSANLKLALQAPLPGTSNDLVEYVKETFPTFDGKQGGILRIRPKTLGPNAPALVYFHGGGLCLRARPTTTAWPGSTPLRPAVRS